MEETYRENMKQSYFTIGIHPSKKKKIDLQTQENQNLVILRTRGGRVKAEEDKVRKKSTKKSYKISFK